MAGGQFLTRLHASSRSSMVNPTRPFLYNPIKNYVQADKGSHGRLMEERAPSTAEEFERVAEEKAKVSREGVAGKAVDKAFDGAEEAAGNAETESAKNGYKEHRAGADRRRKGDQE